MVFGIIMVKSIQHVSKVNKEFLLIDDFNETNTDNTIKMKI